MNIGKIKNVVIIFLCMLVVYQTFGLWFENISGRNFFYTFFSQQNVVSSNIGDYDFTIPQNIVVGFGNKSFNKFFMEEDGKKLNSKIDDCMKYTAEIGEYVKTTQVDWNELLSLKSVICSYSVDMPMDLYIKAMGAKSSQSFSSKQKVFDTLVIIPARSAGEYLKVYFINTNDNTSALFSYKKNNANDNLSMAIENIQKASSNVSYLSTNQSKFSNFSSNVFLPKATNGNISYKSAELYNPYEVYGESSLQSMEIYVDAFFENPIAKWNNIDDNNVYTYSDENIVVRYYPYDLFEYSNYSVKNDNTDNTLPAAYNTAIELIQKDRTIKEDDNIYLSEVTNVNNVWKFGFDYHFQGFVVELSDELKSKLGINHILEVTVEKGTAVSYKRYACKVKNSNFEYNNITIDFSIALSKVMEREKLTKLNINDMYLAFLIYENNEYSDLSWIVDSDDKNYVYGN